MLHNLIWELNRELNFTLNMDDDNQSEWTGNELHMLVSRDIGALAEEEIIIITKICKKYNIKVVRWEFKIGIKEESHWRQPTGKRINILTLYVRPMLKWE